MINLQAKLQKLIQGQMFCRPSLAPLIIAGIISAVTSLAAAGAQSSSNQEAGKAGGAANQANQQLNLKELALNQQQADTQKYATEQDARAQNLDSFNKELSSNKDLKKTMYDMWAGK